MLASVVFMGAVACSVGSMAWLGYFILTRVFNTFLETDRESRRLARNYLIFGGILLISAVVLWVQFARMESPLPTPELGPGMPAASAQPATGVGMEQTLVAIGMVVAGVAFLLWLGVFSLNRSFNTSLEPVRGRRRSGAGQLFFGAVLLGATLFLAVWFFQLESPAPVSAGTAASPAVEEPAAEEPAAEEPAAEEPAAPESEPGSLTGTIEGQTVEIHRAREAASAASAHADAADTVSETGEE